MPRIDKDTGVPVMTWSEFWEHEAKYDDEGRSPGELMDDFYEDMRREEENETERLRSPEGALESFQSAIRSENESRARDREYYAAHPQYKHDPEDLKPLPDVENVLEVVDAQFNFNLKERSSKIVAILEFGDGTKKKGTLTQSHWSGGYYDPPEDDMELNFEEV